VGIFPVSWGNKYRLCRLGSLGTRVSQGDLCCLGRRLHAVASSLDRSGMECCARERLLVMLSKHGHGTKPLKTVGA
jgi:hypothetical protein